ncbi:MAG: TadE/TadG family type IV pilus assembly protein [Roseiarcus sp.]
MTRTIPIPRPIHRRARAFLADAKGLAAVELALILPLMLMLMSLVVFGGQAYTVQRKVTLAATTLANIFAQANNNNASTITQAELDQILAYPNLILYPYDGSTAAVVVSQLLVTVNGNGTATGTVCGSWANANGTARPISQQLSVDPSIASAFSASGSNNNPACGSIPAKTVPTQYVVLGEVSYPFQPTGIYFSVGTMNLHDSIIMIPRVASPICVVTPTTPCPAS